MTDYLEPLTEFFQRHEEFLSCMRSGLLAARKAGDAILRLLKVKDMTANQLFDWLSLECAQSSKRISKSTFYGYLNVASRWGELMSKQEGEVSTLSFRKALKILAKPKVDIVLPITVKAKPVITVIPPAEEVDPNPPAEKPKFQLMRKEKEDGEEESRPEKPPRPTESSVRKAISRRWTCV